MPDDPRTEMLELVNDIDLRRLEAFMAGTGKGLTTREHLALMPEATTHADIQTLHAAREMLDEFSRRVLDVYVAVWRDFGKERCSVCGNTGKQSEAIGYDCAREC